MEFEITRVDCMCQTGMVSIRLRPGLYARDNTESYKDLGDKNRGVQEGQYFTVLAGPIFYGINQSMRLY